MLGVFKAIGFLKNKQTKYSITQKYKSVYNKFIERHKFGSY